MGTILSLIDLVLSVVWYIVIIHVIMSWLINFQVLNLRQPIVAQLWFGLGRLLEPLYSRIRNWLPNTGGLDLAPLIVLIAIIALRDIVLPDLARAIGVY